MAATNSLDLQRHALDYWQIVRNRLGLIVLSFLFIFAAAAVLTYIMPRKYRGVVEMVIERNAENARVVGNQGDPLNLAATENFLKTQFEIITKRRTLDRVVEKLKLVDVWKAPTKQAAAARLIGNLDAQSSIKSDFVVIEYYDEDPKLAADIANAIADSYKETRLETDNERINSAIEQLTAQIGIKEQQTRLALDRMIEIKKRDGIVEEPVYGIERAAGRDDVNTAGSSIVSEAAREVYKIENNFNARSPK